MADALYESISQTDTKCILCDFAWQIYFLLNYCLVLGNAVSDWQADSFSLVLWGPQNSQTFTDPTQFSETLKASKSLSHFSQTFKDRANPVKNILYKYI